MRWPGLSGALSHVLLGHALRLEHVCVKSELWCMPNGSFQLFCRREGPTESVAGGTAWAFHMAILLGLPVFVFDDEVSASLPPMASTHSSQRRQHPCHAPAACCLQEGCESCTRRWHAHDYTQGRLVPCKSGSPAGPSWVGRHHCCGLGTGLPANTTSLAVHAGPPTLVPGVFAGIGTRQLTTAGREAITDVCRRTFKAEGLRSAVA